MRLSSTTGDGLSLARAPYDRRTPEHLARPDRPGASMQPQALVLERSRRSVDANETIAPDEEHQRRNVSLTPMSA
jgi:hypothetical protein